MTNPRIAELAEALHEWEDGPASKASELNCYSCATWPDDNTPAFQPKPGDHCYESAAAIVAALPPGWCGHDEPMRDLVDSNQTWSEVSATVCAAAGVAALVHVPAEIARLRRIEEAARTVSDEYAHFSDCYPVGPCTCGLDALRAALKEDR